MDEAPEGDRLEMARDGPAGKGLEGRSSRSRCGESDAARIEGIEARTDGDRQTGKGEEADDDAENAWNVAFDHRRGDQDDDRKRAEDDNCESDRDELDGGAVTHGAGECCSGKQAAARPPGARH